jgi:secreted trypsin-like serine protease
MEGAAFARPIRALAGAGSCSHVLGLGGALIDDTSTMTPSRSIVFSLVAMAVVLAIAVQVVTPETGQAVRERERAVTEVVHGGDVASGQYPFMAGIGYADRSGDFLWDNQFCGGSLVGPSLVLTAAHCLHGISADQLAVVVGRTVMSSSEGQVRSVSQIIVHPNYNPDNAANDLALLRLNQPVNGITPIQVIGAGDTSLNAPNTLLTVAGWGDARPQPHGGKPAWWPDRLQQGHVSVIDDTTCAREWARTGYHDTSVWSLFLCTSPGQFGSGDSGGPLFAATPSGYVQVSLVSGGYARNHKHKQKKKKQAEQSKQQHIPDYGPELSAPSSADFLASYGV